MGREPIPETDEPLECGTATMWVLFDQPGTDKICGSGYAWAGGFFMAGAERIAHFTLVELLGREADAQPTAPADGLRPPLT